MEVKPIDYCPYYESSDCPDGDDPCGDPGNSTESATQAVFHKHISKSGLKLEREHLAKKLDEYISETIFAFSKELEEVTETVVFEKVFEKFTSRFQTQVTIELPGIIQSTLSEENLNKFDEEDSIRTIQEDFPTLFKEVLLKMRNTYLLSEKFQTLKVALEMIIDKSNTDLHQRFTLNQKFQKTIEEYGSSFSMLNYNQFKNIITDIVLDKSS